MSDATSISRGRFPWLRELAKLCQWICAKAGTRVCIDVEAPDQKLMRDIGVSPGANIGVRDVRAAFYAKMLERGHPLQ